MVRKFPRIIFYFILSGICSEGYDNEIKKNKRKASSIVNKIARKMRCDDNRKGKFSRVIAMCEHVSLVSQQGAGREEQEHEQ